MLHAHSIYGVHCAEICHNRIYMNMKQIGDVSTHTQSLRSIQVSGKEEACARGKKKHIYINGRL